MEPERSWKRPAECQPQKGGGNKKGGGFSVYKNWGGVAPAWRDIRKPGQ